MFKKIIKYSLYSLVFLLPLFFLPFSLEAFNFNKGYLLFFLTLIGVLAWLSQMIFKEKKIRIKTSILDLSVLVFMIVMVLASIFTKDQFSSIYGFYGRFFPSLVGILSLGMFYFLVSNNVKTEPKDKSDVTVKGMISVFLNSCVVLLVVSYLAIFNIFSKIAVLPDVMSLRSFNTVAGTLESLSLFCVFVSVLSLAILALKETIKLKSKAVYALPFLSLGLLVIINFKVAWIALLVSLVLFLAFSFWKRVFKENVNKLSLSIVFILIALLFLLFNPLRTLLPEDNVLNNLPSEILLTQKASWRLGVESVKENALFGSGLSNFSYVFSQHRPEGFIQSSLWQLRFDRSGSHLAEILATTGIIGSLSYLVLIISFLLICYLFISSIKAENQEKRIIVIPLFVAAVSLLIIQLFYYQNFVLSFSFWLVLALGAVSFGGARKQREYSFSDFPEIGLVFSIVFWVALIAGLFLCFTFGKYYTADVYYRSYLVNPNDNLPKLERAIRLMPGNDNYHLALSRDYLAKLILETQEQEPDTQKIANLVSLSVDESKTAIEVGKNKVVPYEMAGIVYRNLVGLVEGTREWAIKSFEDALLLEPNNPAFLTEIGRLQEDQEMKKEYFKEQPKLNQIMLMLS